jgi:4-amino-4-deoxy-L-arabinose transferase-like glycosyltransferase
MWSLSPRHEVLVLVVLLGSLYAVGLGSIGLIDYDEAAYAETARRMVRSGDYLTPRLADEAFFEKPPLLYWLMAAGYGVFGFNEWGARLPSALATLLTALLLHGLLRRSRRPDAALPTALVFGLGIEVFGLARLALTDAGLTLLTSAVIVMGFLAVTRPGRARPWHIVTAGVAVGLAILAKGLVGLALPAGILGVFLLIRGRLREGLRRLAPVRVILVAAVVAAPWFVLMVRTHGAVRFFEEFFVQHHVRRFVTPMEGHSGGPLYYVGVILVGFFPWVVLLPHAVKNAWPQRGSARLEDGGVRDLDRAADLPLFALIWAACTLLFFSVSETKLPQYIAPAFPALAVLVGLLWPELRRTERSSILHWPGRILAGLSVLLGAIVLALPWLFDIARSSMSADALKKNPFLPESIGWLPPLVALGIGLVAFGVAIAVIGRRTRPARGLLVWGTTALLSLVIWLGPSLDAITMAPLRELSRSAGRATPADDPVLVFGLRRLPSVAFYADRTHIRLRRKKLETLRRKVALGRPFAGIAPRRKLEQLAEVEGLRVARVLGNYVLFDNVD